jgi:hypothetical protein
MAEGGYPGIHAGMPTAQRLRSASGNGAGRSKAKAKAKAKAKQSQSQSQNQSQANTCGSEPAREKPESTAGCRAPSVIVDDHRRQAELA